MSLETLYNQAPSNSYAGIVRNRQAADAAAGQSLVNYLDGQARGRTPVPDQIQKEFTRNPANSYVSSGGQPIPRAVGESLTRFTDKAFKIAFDGVGPSQLAQGFYVNQYRTAVGPSGATTIHNYTPVNGKKFRDLSTSARNRINQSPSGAPTSL